MQAHSNSISGALWYHHGFLYSICNWVLNKAYIFWAQYMSFFPTWLCVLYMAGTFWKMADRGESLRGALWHRGFSLEFGQVEGWPLGSLQCRHSLSRPRSQRHVDIWIFNSLVLKRGTVYCLVIQQRNSTIDCVWCQALSSSDPMTSTLSKFWDGAFIDCLSTFLRKCLAFLKLNSLWTGVIVMLLI